MEHALRILSIQWNYPPIDTYACCIAAATLPSGTRSPTRHPDQYPYCYRCCSQLHYELPRTRIEKWGRSSASLAEADWRASPCLLGRNVNGNANHSSCHLQCLQSFGSLSKTNYHCRWEGHWASQGKETDGRPVAAAAGGGQRRTDSRRARHCRWSPCGRENSSKAQVLLLNCWKKNHQERMSSSEGSWD